MSDLVRWNEIERQIDAAHDLKQIGKMHDQLEAIKIMARQIDGSLTTVNKASKYKFLLEQQTGRLYKELPAKPGARTDLVNPVNEVTTKQEAAKEVDKSRVVLSRWVRSSEIPRETVEKYEAECNERGEEFTSAGIIAFQKDQERNEREIDGEDIDISAIPQDERWSIHTGDFSEIETEAGLILTDPPYPSEFLDEWTKLASWAKKNLKPNRFLVAYSGQMNLPEVYRRLTVDLNYYWTFALLHNGNTQIIDGRNVDCGWKPILVFQNGFKKLKDTIHDVIEGSGREKKNHPWQQGKDELEYLIDRFSRKGDTIVDPFCGSGTTIIKAVSMERRAIGIERNPTTAKKARKRISDGLQNA